MNRKHEGSRNRSLPWFIAVSLLMPLMLVAAEYSHKFAATAFEDNQSPNQVDIDIAPVSAGGNAKSTTSRPVNVTIFSSSRFDAATVTQASITLRDAVSKEGAVGASRVAVRDVDGDGHPDLIAEFPALKITGPTKMILEGRTTAGTLIQGTACVQASGIPCGGTTLGNANQTDQEASAAPAGPQGGVVPCSENFDGVTAPALPIGWAAATAIDCTGTPNSNPWETSTAGTPAPAFDTAPNAAFANDPNCISDERLDSPNFAIVSTTAVLTFRQNRNLENGFDGTVLEVSKNGAAFQDIIVAGAAFGGGGYNGVISVNFGSPIAGRNAWTGNSAGFVTTTVNLPASANGQNWRFRWRRATDSSVAGQGFRLDSLSLAGSNCSLGGCVVTCPANVTQTNDPNQCGAVVNYPPPTTTGICGSVTCSPPSGSFFPVGTTTVTCTETGVPAGPTGGASCTFTVTVTDDQPPSITCPANVTVSNDPNQCGAVVNYPPPTVTDNCPGSFTATCVPASGSFFPVGTTTVTCTVDGFSNGAAPTGQCQNPVTITHSSSQAITPLNSVSCNDGIGHTDNSYYRAFTLSSFGITTAFDVQSIDIGIEEASSNALGAPKGAPKRAAGKSSISHKSKTSAPGGVGQPATVNIYTSNQPFPTGFPGSLTLIGTAMINVADQTLTVINVPITGTAAAGSELVVEVFTPDGSAAGNLFFIGSNASAETGPSYLRAADCGVTTPTTTAAIGFPNMHIVMNVNGCPQAAPGGGSSCTFTVTVNDTQPPTVTCPANVTAVTNQDCGAGAVCTVVNFTATASDNCPGVVVVCNPPSGSCFPVGITTVTCTATDASGNTATCSFTVTTFDTLLQDDSDPTIILLWNSLTGQYRFCCNGTTYTGVGTSIIQGCVFTLVHNPVDRRVLGRVDKAVHAGSASIQAPPGTIRCTIFDRNTLNDTFVGCQ